jgi:formylglycine-generating enzyme required for sulfatase activity
MVLDLGDGVALKLGPIPPGKFLMADAKDPKAPPREVTISRPFHMGVYEVTRGQYAQFIKDSRYTPQRHRDGKMPARRWDAPGFDQTDDHPVTWVTWEDADAFCKWLSKRTGRTVKLPSEQQWEYACRAGATGLRYWEGEPTTAPCNAADQSYAKAAGKKAGFPWDDGSPYTAPAGQFAPNAFGLYDMLGNVWEWCDQPAAPATAPATQATQPQRTPMGQVRGGAFDCTGSWLKCGERHGHPLSSPRENLGFRVIVEPAAEAGS